MPAAGLPAAGLPAAAGLTAARAGRLLGACSASLDGLAPAVALADLRVAFPPSVASLSSPAASSMAAARFLGPSVSSSTLSCFFMYAMMSACELNRLPSAL